MPAKTLMTMCLPDACPVCHAAQRYHVAAENAQPEQGPKLMALCFLQGFALALQGFREICLEHAAMLGEVHETQSLAEGWPEFAEFWKTAKQLRLSGGSVTCRIVQHQDISFKPKQEEKTDGK